MELSARERGGSRKLLKLLDPADLLALTATVTKKKSTAYAEAIDTILQNSQSAYELLNRRKVLRDIIAAYLKNEGVPIPSNITKAEAVQKTLVYWSDLDSCVPDVGNSLQKNLHYTAVMGMSEREIGGSRKLLELLDPTDLLALAATVTKNKSTVSTRAGAIDTILQYSQSAYELLNRRKVLCNIIAAYLKNEGVPIPSNISKAEAVQKTLVYWSDLDSCVLNVGTSLQKNLHYTVVMRLNAREIGGCRKLLELLDPADLLALAATVTKKKSTASTKAEAINTILQNSQSAYELLNRRKVLRDIIAAYLKNEGVPIPSNITKAEAVLQALMHWSKLDSCVPVAAPFISSPAPQKATATDFSHPFYFHTSKSSIHSPREDASNAWNLQTQTTDLYEILTSVNFIQDRNPITSPSKQEKVSDTSVRQHQKVSSDVTSSPLPFDISKLSMHSCQKEDRNEQKSQPWDPQRLGIAAEARGQRYLRSKLCSHQEKSSWQSGPDGEEMERECLQSEEMSPQHYKKVSQLQTAHDKRNTKEVMASLFTATEE